MPQLDASTFTSQLFWLCICFFTMYFIMSKFIVPKIAETIEQRRHRIDGYLEKAAVLKEQAEKTLDAYQAALKEASDKADAALENATKEMNDFVAERQAELQLDLSKKIQQAEKQIAKTKEEAAREIRQTAEVLAEAVLAKLDVKNISKAEIRNALDAQLKQD